MHMVANLILNRKGGHSMHFRRVQVKMALFIFMFAAVTITGCGGNMLTYKGDKVNQQKFIVQLQEGNQQGVWKTNDLAVKYQYQMTPEKLKIDGTIEMVGGITTGFKYIKNLSVNLLLLDNQGNLIGNSRVNLGSIDLTIPIPIRFERTIPIPGGVQTISFAYDGTFTTGSGGGDNRDFSFSPY